MTEAFDELRRTRRAGVIRAFARRCPEAWSFEEMARRAGDSMGSIMRTERGVLKADARRGFLASEGAIRGFVGRVRAREPDPGYLTMTLDELPAALADSIDAPGAFRRASFRRGKLWMSAKGTVSPLHFDAADNLHVQLHGRKIFRTFAPADRPYLYPCSLFSGTPNFSRVDAESPDLERFPAFAHARCTLHELEAGDAIFLPLGHFHHVRSAEESVSVNFWWSNGTRALVSHAADAWKRLRSVSR